MTPPRGTEAHEHDPTSDQPLWERVWESRRALMAPRSSYAIDPYRIVERRFTPDYIPQTETLFTLSNGSSGCVGRWRRCDPSTAAPRSWRTASTRPGRSPTARRRSGSPRSGRPSCRCPTGRSSSSTSTTSRSR
ncbi:MAG: hypothetical protein R2699_00565 [Acidimicrobiales bacterium]